MIRLEAPIRARDAACLVCLLNALLVAPWGAWSDPGDRERADLLVRQAVAELAAGRPAAARDWARRALEFDAASADAHAVLGLIHSAEGLSGKAVGDYGRAVSAGGFRVTRESDARTACAAALVRMRRYREAVAVLDALGPGEGGAEALLLRARAARRLGDLEEARRAAIEATARYPDSAEAYVLLAEIEQSDNRFGEVRRVLEAARSRLPASAAVALALLELLPASAAKPLVGAYFSLASRSAATDARASVAALRLDPEGAGTYLERFIASGGPGDVDLFREARSLVAEKPDLAQSLDKALETWTGTRSSDADRDGYADRRFVLAGGVLREWAVDDDQDGLEEIVAATAPGGSFESVTLREWAGRSEAQGAVEESLVAEFAEYPWVGRVTVLQVGRRREYDLLPHAYRLRVADRESRAAEPRLSADFLAPREADIRAASWGCRDFRLPEDLLVSRCELEGGRILRVVADADGDGREDHIVLYRDGEPASGSRDLDNDGVFETREGYADGKLDRIEVDADGDGRPEYVRLFSESGGEEWDLDLDGIMDIERSRGIVTELRTSLRTGSTGGRR